MPEILTIRRHTPRSFAQIALDQTLRDEEAYTSIAHDLKATRRAARLLAPEVAKFRLGLDLTNLANLRVTENKVVIFVSSSAQHARLRQLAPRLTRLIAEAGLPYTLDIKIRPVTPTIELRDNLAHGNARVASQEVQETVRRAGDAMEDSPLKRALESLARTMQKTANQS